MKNSISLEEAQKILFDKVYPVSEEYVLIEDSLGRILSQDLIASEDVPSFNKSPLDGYALMANDTTQAAKGKPAVFKVIEELPAGHIADKKIEKGCAFAINTGSPIPDGADAVVKFEDVERYGDLISVFTVFKSGDNIIFAGDDVKTGEKVAQKGIKITPPLIGLLASLGIYKIKVYRKPIVAIISTGDELIDMGEKVGPGKIRNSNSYCLSAICREVGAEKVVYGNVRDNVDDISDKLSSALKVADLVLTTGGASVGNYDLVQEAFKKVGGRLLYWRLNIKPGAPNGAAIIGEKLLISLSGNPASALTVFQMIIIPALKKLAGQKNYNIECINGVLYNGYKKPSPNRRLLRGMLKIFNGKVFIDLMGVQSNACLSSMVGCNLMVDVPAGSGPLKSGDTVKAFLIQDIARVD